MKGDLTLKALEYIGRTALTISDLAVVMALAPYGSSYGQLDKFLRDYRRQRKQFFDKISKERSFYNLVSRLKKEGLVEKKLRGKNNFFTLTRKGKIRLEKLKQRKNLQSLDNQSLKEDRLKIVIFDIPEVDRRKRFWLRSALKNLDFTMLQKSVWIGKTKLPQTFLDALRQEELLSCVEIFEVSKKGSLK